jgi:MFS family permease
MQTASSRSLFSLYLAYFADYFSWGAAIAFLAIYISADQSPFATLLWDRQLSLGIAVACFPIGEVIGSPIFGDLSDLIGRRAVLLWGLLGSVVSMAICAVGLWKGSFSLFLVGQLLAGFFAGKQALAQAAIAEFDTGTKGQKLAFLSVLGGIAWILGPYSGNLLLQEQFVAMGGYIWPSLLASAVFGISLVCTYLFFNDTYQPKLRHFSVTPFLKNIGQLFAHGVRDRMFFLFFLNLMGWYLLVVSLSYYLIQKFHLTDSQVTVFNSYLGLCFTLGGILGTAWILHRFRARKILFWTQIAGAFGIFSLFGSEKIAELWLYLAIPALTEALIYPAYQIILSETASDQNQGKVFGLVNASNGACQFLAGAILGAVPPNCVGGYILIAALLFLISGAFLPFALKGPLPHWRRLPIAKSGSRFAIRK